MGGGAKASAAQTSAQATGTGPAPAIMEPPVFKLTAEQLSQAVVYTDDNHFKEAAAAGYVDFGKPWLVQECTEAIANMSVEPLATTLKNYRKEFPKQNETKTKHTISTPLPAGAGDKLAAQILKSFEPPEMLMATNSNQQISNVVKGVGSVLFLQGYAESCRTIGTESLMMGTLYAVHTGNMLIHPASCKGYVEWCVKHSGRGPAQIPLKKILASLREGKVRVGDEQFMLSTMVAQPGSIYWDPAGWLVARKADNLCSVALRKSFVVMASYSMEELSAHVSLQPVAEARGIQEREILKEIVHARLPAPKALQDQQVEKKPESQNTPSPPGALPPAVPPLAELAEQEQAGASQATAPGQPEQAELRAVAAPSPDSPALVELAEAAWAA